VTNVGTSVADAVVPRVEATSGAALGSRRFRAPLRRGPVNLAAGSAQTFTWRWSANAVGTAAFTATASGYSPALSATVLGDGSVAVDIIAPVVLVGSLVVFPGPRRAGSHL